MLKIVIIMLSGILVGRVLHRHRLSVIPRVITVLIWMLLFLLGIEVGSNERIINGLIEIGGEALTAYVWRHDGQCSACMDVMAIHQ